MKKSLYCICILFAFQFSTPTQAQSVAHEWSENLLEAIRNDFARPTVHARNLYHCSMAMYDIWSVYDTTNISEQVLLGKTLDGITCPIIDFPVNEDLHSAREKAISYAMYRIMQHRFEGSPGEEEIYSMIDNWMIDHGYQTKNISTDYEFGDPAALGNYVAQCIIQYGAADNSNEENDYSNIFYEPVNESLIMEFPGNPTITDLNAWQPLTLEISIDQSGNVTPTNTPPFLSPEWGSVFPFALQEDDLTVFDKDGNDYWVYHDPGPPPLFDILDPIGTAEYKWGFSLVSKWSAHLDDTNPVNWDISPASIGNIQDYPETIEELRDFYDAFLGGDPGTGRDINPKTGEPYEPQIVPRGDYGRILAEFWADGPDSETPPGHWFTILNEIKVHPEYDKRFNGKGEILDELEYDVKAYLTLAGALHDCAITAWGIKGYYDYIRPVSAIRAMADFGQSTDPMLPSYHPAGIELEESFVELVESGDPLAGMSDEHVGKIKLFAWRGPDYIFDPRVDEAGVGWILAENWWPYQRPSFVTPNFAGYISGHSTFSRAAAEVLTNLTNDEYFPGGMGVFSAPQDEFLVFEDGPSIDIELQWATYRDASDQCSLSRIWGGIHPPADDIPGRLIGIEIGTDAYHFARDIFYNDMDGDGYYSYEDCDDENPMINPGIAETCDGVDENCNGEIDEGIPLNTYYADVDGDGYGDINNIVEICELVAPEGYVTDNTDCDDAESEANPGSVEICDEIDNDCNGIVDDGIEVFRYYYDGDADSFGDAAIVLDTCAAVPPANFVPNNLDCNDSDDQINPAASEICDAIDNDCSGAADDGLEKFRYYLDADDDGYGDAAMTADTCIIVPPVGFVDNDLDCNDNDAAINPDAIEVCDAIDNDCNGFADDGLDKNRYYQDADGDGFGNAMMVADTCIQIPPVGFVKNDLDCNDDDAAINPDAIEICDAIDNDCNGFADDGLEKNRYYQDADGDGFGNSMIVADTCILIPPVGFAANDLDCNDDDAAINPDAIEVCDAIDNDCNGFADDGLEKLRYYRDFDGDLFGDQAIFVDTCILFAPEGFVEDQTDCDDQAANINPAATDISDNNVDEDCSGSDYFQITKFFPNPVGDELTIHYEYQGFLRIIINDLSGRTVFDEHVHFVQNRTRIRINNIASGIYFLRIISNSDEVLVTERFCKG